MNWTEKCAKWFDGFTRMIGGFIESFLYNIGALLAPLPSAATIGIIMASSFQKWAMSQSAFSVTQISWLSLIIGATAAFSIESVMFSSFRYGVDQYQRNKEIVSLTIPVSVVTLSIAALVVIEVIAGVGIAITVFGCLFALLSALSYLTRAFNTSNERMADEIEQKVKNDMELKKYQIDARKEVSLHRAELKESAKGGSGHKETPKASQSANKPALTRSQEAVLNAIRDNGGMDGLTFNDLARIAGCTRQTASSTVKKLANMELI